MSVYQAELSFALGIGLLLLLGYGAYRWLQRVRERQRELAELRSPARLAALRADAQQKELREARIKQEERLLEAARQRAERAAQQQAEAERRELERMQQSENELDQAIHAWQKQNEQEEELSRAAEIAEAKAAAAAIEAKISEMDQSLAKWEFEQMHADFGQGVLQSTHIRAKQSAPGDKVAKIKEQISVISLTIGKEFEDLEYVINKIQTGVDFLPIQVQETINKWKDGQIHRRSTLEDLKLRFRYQAYSVEDGLELYYMYSEWIARQRRRLLRFIGVLGTEPGKAEGILALIERAEKVEWSKQLDINMDILACLKEIREIYRISVNMERRLKELEKICRRRSDQIIQPRWEPKGTL